MKQEQAIDRNAMALQAAADSKALEMARAIMTIVARDNLGGAVQTMAGIQCAIAEAIKPLMARAAGLPPARRFHVTDEMALAFHHSQTDGAAGADDIAEIKEGLSYALSGYEEWLEDHRRLVRELDVLLNGDNAAKQASLCDIVSQVRSEGIRAGIPSVSFYRDGLVDAADWVDHSREAFERERGQQDPDTGTLEFSNEADREYSSILVDVAEGIRRLHPNVMPKRKPFKDVAPNDVVPVGNDWFRIRYITRHGSSTSVHLQREADPLTPYGQNDVIHLSVENDIPLMIAVKAGQ